MSKKLHPSAIIPELNGITIGDFWAWAYSDTLNNRNRAIFAEFLVGTALGILDKPRVEWDAYDLLYRDKKIEVKAAGFLQSWQQNDLSAIRFDIEAKKAWDATANTYSVVPIRVSDCYVFCLHHEVDRKRVDVFDIAQWEFYVVGTEYINQQFGQQKSIGLTLLRSIVNPVHYGDMKQAIDKSLGFE